MLKDALPKIVTPLPGPKAREIIQRRAEAVPGSIKCAYPCVIARGEGAMVEDVDGNVLLDWVGGVGVLNIGYSHPELVAAVKEQSEKYFHAMMNIMTHEGYIKLAEKLNAIVPVKGTKRKTMFVNSGAEADENAVKIAKSYTKRPNIIVFSGAFHGRTLLASTMTSKKAYSAGIGPYPDGVYRAEFPYLYRAPGCYTEAEAIQYYIEKLERVFEEASPAEYVAAIVVEPVQGEGGFVPAPFEWIRAVRKICDEHGILLIADEVQTGFARSGKMFVSNYWAEFGCAPDIIATAKSIAGGVPLSAVTARAEIFDGVKDGIIGGTYGGNALACASALKVIEIIERDKLCDRSLDIAEKCKKAFLSWKDKYEAVGDVRGIGCMMGIEFVTDKKSKAPNAGLVAAIVVEAAKNGLIIESAGVYGNVIRFLSPLVVTDAQLEAGLSILEAAIKACV
ncbi:4-aminobutyrate aminotransferase / (S)-3-amino-2-methylpropionate transaminase [Sporobacter termitidis DSM 10068]|uniref:(S)-3-amino-2-methylpropionate transaminase n=1 Tax=Sporobacter termitidis DSM 10068 TaxID=1123282 RepID=A0A1M5XEK1_9FIRM|nr:aspartate aminotransferase family protein [Sporobacter termitidis]SHH98179.1 4-aminobutyrate aminotransferase / (S)-3-amino-2-methylpropionate transaminase [Sporobacter termitidis DSM 10068]